MFPSKEIRWFSKNENKAITNWFARKAYHFGSINGRTDHYLPCLKSETIGFKLREGNVELKHRIQDPELIQITNSAEG